MGYVIVPRRAYFFISLFCFSLNISILRSCYAIRVLLCFAWIICVLLDSSWPQWRSVEDESLNACWCIVTVHTKSLFWCVVLDYWKTTRGEPTKREAWKMTVLFVFLVSFKVLQVVFRTIFVGLSCWKAAGSCTFWSIIRNMASFEASVTVFAEKTKTWFLCWYQGLYYVPSFSLQSVFSPILNVPSIRLV